MPAVQEAAIAEPAVASELPAPASTPVIASERQATPASASAQTTASARAASVDQSVVQEVPRRPTPVPVERSVATASAPAPAAPPAAVSNTEESSREITVTGSKQLVIENATPVPQDRAGFDASPPVTADTPEVQRAWLERIRELRDAGKIAEARESLARFIERHPKAELPADLKPLLPIASPDPSPQP